MDTEYEVQDLAKAVRMNARQEFENRMILMRADSKKEEAVERHALAMKCNQDILKKKVVDMKVMADNLAKAQNTFLKMNDVQECLKHVEEMKKELEVFFHEKAFKEI